MSERIKDGGPAFPVERDAAFMPVTDMYGQDISSGMSLRDYFAAKAMQALISSTDPQSIGITYERFKERTSLAAFEYADAMLAAREAKP